MDESRLHSCRQEQPHCPAACLLDLSPHLLLQLLGGRSAADACVPTQTHICVCVDIADLIVVDDDLLCLATAIRHAVPVPGMHMRLSCRWRGAPGQVELRALYDPRKMFPLHPIAVTQPSLECRYRKLSWLDTEPSIVTEPTCRQRPSPTTSPRSSLMAGGTAQRERQLTDGKTNY